MAYTVVIEYKPVEGLAEQFAMPVCGLYNPTSSYIDSAVYEDGHTVASENASTLAKSTYGKSVYATNVEGFGEIAMPEPFATESIPMDGWAQFKLAMVQDEDNKVTFDVEDYKEAFWYKTVGAQLVDRGFTVTVTKNA